MKHDKKSLLVGILIGRAMDGWATALRSGFAIVKPVTVQRAVVPVLLLQPPPVIPVTNFENEVS